MQMLVSPPTRGWTFLKLANSTAAVGFPAHAGMDPTGSTRRPPCEWFPRPRGDGPVTRCSPRSSSLVSPPTRGWTSYRSLPPGVVIGFPAHAGMDPSRAGSCRPAIRFPRPRGDGPPLRHRSSRCVVVSPPTRGWTRSLASRLQALLGFPAHAGMDPRGADRLGSPRRFPRPRGDGPRRSAKGWVKPRVSPPTRGWTSVCSVWRRLLSGFPAHAGMDLIPMPRAAPTWWFPRPRGDGPLAYCAALGCQPVSPPTRGWTPDHARGRRDLLGFPAHAGMDPSILLRCVAERRFPRPRGDGPLGNISLNNTERVSPPTRGWTGEVLLYGPIVDGFPAHAGMDLRSRQRGR